VSNASTTGGAFGDRAIHVLQIHGSHPGRWSEPSREEFIDSQRARSLGNSAGPRRVFSSLTCRPLDERKSLVERKPLNRRQNLVDVRSNRQTS
jgi:hypothetical protein